MKEIPLKTDSKLKWPNKQKNARFNVYRVSRETRFGTVESRNEHLTKFFSVMKERWVIGKCVGRESASEVTDRGFEKPDKVIYLK
jgi:hypothetical protein